MPWNVVTEEGYVHKTFETEEEAIAECEAATEATGDDGVNYRVEQQQ